jgi:hypothetical protein
LSELISPISLRISILTGAGSVIGRLCRRTVAGPSSAVALSAAALSAAEEALQVEVKAVALALAATALNEQNCTSSKSHYYGNLDKANKFGHARTSATAILIHFTVHRTQPK